jgi:predicted nucleotidyltransferase
LKKEKKAIIEILNKKSDIVFAYIFGSKAKGYANEMSDWDIAVYFKEHSKRDSHWPEFILEAELSRTIGAPVQVIVLNKPLDPVFGFEIVKDSILLLDKRPNVRIDFENRILRHYHDWQYFLKRQLKAEQQLPR